MKTTITILTALLCGCSPEHVLTLAPETNQVDLRIPATNETLNFVPDGTNWVEQTKPRFKPYSIVCSTNGTYTWTSFDGEVYPWIPSFETREAAVRSLEGLLAWKATQPSRESQREQERKEERAYRLKGWQECEP